MESDVTTLVIEIGNALRVRTFLNQNIYILASRDTHSHSTFPLDRQSWFGEGIDDTRFYTVMTDVIFFLSFTDQFLRFTQPSNSLFGN